MIELGQILDGKYRIVRLIGEGGMGAVFEGENTFIHRRVAIKVLHPQASADSGAVMRFEREAQAAGRIGSDHILEVLDLGRMEDGSRYMVMEFLDGEPLSSRIRRMGRLTGPQMAPLVRQILVGLGAAHGAGIVHRDLKPDNIFILREKAGTRDYIKIIDFGISKFNALSGDMSMTRTGAVMGTPYYMSPEQAKGSGVDHRTDIYAVGVIMYEAATGSVPFTGNTFNELMFKIALSTPQPMREVVPDVDPRFADFVEKAMARDLSARFESAAEMLQALDGLAFGPAASAPPGPLPHQQVPTPAVGAFTPATGLVTQDSFAASQAAPSSRSLGPAIAVGAGLLVLAGGAFAAYRAFSGGAGDPSAAASSSAAVPAAPAPEVAADKPAANTESVAPTSLAPPASAVSAAPKAIVQARPATAAAAKPVAKTPTPAPASAPAKPKSRDFGY